MTRFTTLFLAASFALTAAATASAQDTSATLRVDQGTIMASEGGSFATAQTGQALVAGSRLMVAEQSAATVTYAKGCTRTYTAPGVYVVEANCTKAVVAGTDWASAAKIAGGVVITAALLENMDKVDFVPPPVSR
ncbi:hypothetical protein DT603_07725 [Pseudoxanthomonas gei]|uniref:Uncharacterized protein n=1 Tax=Pseudoxanthomonas gei TaxID=1383030 RepID=A0ABX0AAY8_9GAMM|nr:hypothetical protein [Pseudoxanthomonas gei]NDK38728.1 hypothetical protein [Pseudoxanthomonas gei]